MRLFVSGLRKLVRRPASWVTLGLLMALLTLILIAVGTSAGRLNGGGQTEFDPRVLVTFPGAYDRILTFILGLGGLFAVIYGAAIAGSEWSWGTLKTVVARGESRSGYMLMSFAAIVVVIGVGLLLTFGVGVLGALLSANLAGVSTYGLGDPTALGELPGHLARGWLAVVEEGALGFAIATVARSQLAGIGVGIAFYFGEGFATIFLPDIVKYLPFAVASASVSTGSGGNGPFGGGAGQAAALPADQALLLVVVWLVGALVVTALFSERAEISG